MVDEAELSVRADQQPHVGAEPAPSSPVGQLPRGHDDGAHQWVGLRQDYYDALDAPELGADPAGLLELVDSPHRFR